MSENYTIKALQRDTKFKSVGRKLRNEGYALATLYGRENQYSIAVELKEFVKVFSLAGQHDIITLDIENDKAREVLVKDYQIDGIKRSIRHIDFYEIDRNKKIKTYVPIHIEGVRLGGGTLEQVEYGLPIRALPGSIPRELIVDVSELKVGDSLHISDIKFPEGVDPVGDGSKAVVTVVTTQDDEAANKGAEA
ncbi:50S ribosomal protein L25 [Brachyspira innocens]|uniref:50S ribosomal protein L25 n=1 Tax=Brachyspira innocens TaxID=13264 RepID=UPI00037C020F|nr:50S ribosomal protein L25 [Brachyspira innocens]